MCKCKEVKQLKTSDNVGNGDGDIKMINPESNKAPETTKNDRSELPAQPLTRPPQP